MSGDGGCPAPARRGRESSGPECLGRIQVEGTGDAGHAKEIQAPGIHHRLRDEPFQSDAEDEPGFRLGRRRGIEHVGLGPVTNELPSAKNRDIRPPW